MSLSKANRTTALELIQKMAYSKDEETYEQNITTFSGPVVQYFKDNWHALCSEWVIGLQHQSETLLNSINNRLSSRKMKKLK